MAKVTIKTQYGGRRSTPMQAMTEDIAKNVETISGEYMDLALALKPDLDVQKLTFRPFTIYKGTDRETTLYNLSYDSVAWIKKQLQK